MFHNDKGHRLYRVFVRVPTSMKSIASKALSMCLYGHLEARTRTATCPPPSETSMPIPTPSVPCQRVLIVYSERAIDAGDRCERRRRWRCEGSGLVHFRRAEEGHAWGKMRRGRRSVRSFLSFLSLADDATVSEGEATIGSAQHNFPRSVN